MWEPVSILKVAGELILEFIYLFAGWRFTVCFFAGLALGWYLFETVSHEPLRYILAGAAVILGGWLGNRWDRGTS